jgi:hypothetical protein
MQRSLFVVEGPHDEAVLGRLLRERGLKSVTWLADLDPFWGRLVPRTFPHRDDLRARVPVPSFYASETYSVGILAAVGIDNLVRTANTSLLLLPDGLSGLGLVLDSDDLEVTAAWEKLQESLKNGLPELKLGEIAGSVNTQADGFRFGGYVLPDNQRSGTLEAILLECAEVAYPTLLSAARAWIDALDPHDKRVFVNAEERKDLIKPSGKDKAILGVIANVLRPGRAVQASIQDNRWLRDPECLKLPKVAALGAFVDAVIGVTSPTSPTAPAGP